MIHQNDSNKSSAQPGYSVPELFQFLKKQSEQPNSSSQSFGKYKIQDVLSSRENSAILLTFDPDLRRQVVLKVYKPNISQDRKQLILNEGQALAQIDCQNVARCFSVELLEDCPYLVLEYISGKTLDRLNIPLDSDHALQITQQVAQGIESVHERGLLHLDLKPSNVILADDGTVKLIDFGLAQPMSGVAFGQVSGTPAYMAPEVARHELSNIDRRADVFGVGAILYHLLTGESPFKGESNSEILHAAQDGKSRAPDEVDPRISKFANDLCVRCLDENPAKRFDGVDELRSVLDLENRKAIRGSFFWPVLGAILLVGWLAWSLIPGNSSSEFVSLENRIVELMDSGSSTNDMTGDFDLEILNEEFQGAAPTKIRQSDICFLKIKPEIECQVAVLSVEFTDGDPDLKTVVAIPVKDQYVFQVAAGSEHVHPIEFNLLTPNDEIEYLVIAAKTSNWNPIQTAKMIRERVDNETNLDVDVVRGATSSEKEFFQAIAILPYRVVPK